MFRQLTIWLSFVAISIAIVTVQVVLVHGAEIPDTSNSNHARGSKSGGVQSSICDTYDGSHAGQLTSPNYPDCYPNDVHCTLVLEGDSNHMIEFYIYSSFGLEPCCDYLEIRDGPNGSSPLIGRYTGSEKPPPILSNSNYLWITFHTDESGTDVGFFGDFTMLEAFSADNARSSAAAALLDQREEFRAGARGTDLAVMNNCTVKPTTVYEETAGPPDTTPTPGGGGGSPNIVINNNNNMFVNFFGNWTSPDSFFVEFKKKLGLTN